MLSYYETLETDKNDEKRELNFQKKKWFNKQDSFQTDTDSSMINEEEQALLDLEEWINSQTNSHLPT